MHRPGARHLYQAELNEQRRVTFETLAWALIPSLCCSCSPPSARSCAACSAAPSRRLTPSGRDAPRLKLAPFWCTTKRFDLPVSGWKTSRASTLDDELGRADRTHRDRLLAGQLHGQHPVRAERDLRTRPAV